MSFPKPSSSSTRNPFTALSLFPLIGLNFLATRMALRWRTRPGSKREKVALARSGDAAQDIVPPETVLGIKKAWCECVARLQSLE